MSEQLSWIGLKSNGYSSREIMHALKLEYTGNSGSYNDFKMATLELGNGWLVFCIDDFLSPLVQDINLANYSKDFEIVGFQVHEGIMVSKMSHFGKGALSFVIMRDAQRRKNSLVETGKLPEYYAELKSQAMNAQKGKSGIDWLFELPVQVAERVVGYRYGTRSNKNKYREVIFKSEVKTKSTSQGPQRTGKLWKSSPYWGGR